MFFPVFNAFCSVFSLVNARFLSNIASAKISNYPPFMTTCLPLWRMKHPENQSAWAWPHAPNSFQKEAEAAGHGVGAQRLCCSSATTQNATLRLGSHTRIGTQVVSQTNRMQERKRVNSRITVSARCRRVGLSGAHKRGPAVLTACHMFFCAVNRSATEHQFQEKRNSTRLPDGKSLHPGPPAKQKSRTDLHLSGFFMVAAQ